MVYRGYAPAGGGDLPYMSRDYHSASEHGDDYLDAPRFRDDSDARSLDSMPYRRGGRRDEDDDGPVRDRRPFRSRSGDSRDERPRYPMDGPRRPDRPLVGGPRMRSNRNDDRYMERPRSSRYRDEEDYDYHRESNYREADYHRESDYRRDGDYHRENDYNRDGECHRDNDYHHRENTRYVSRKEPRTIRSRSHSQDEQDDYPRYRDRKDGPRYPVDDESRYPEGGRYRSRGGWSGHSSRRDSEESTPAPSVPEEPAVKNQYQNDGSFLEMFKKMQEAQNPKPEEGANAASVTDGANKPDEQTSAIAPKKPMSLLGKRRGGRVLPTGKVKKLKREDEEEKPTNAWSIYMAEVRKYKEASCEEEGKTRPLVK
ncbi:hypothetical protein PR048_032514 [Dryococelus australis]|uniref:Uncharacterized protein n=1 Tax=Dryococelus australis TaxID=614101 RepID=A0ABQ9G5J9_9NEOP|nr:hypothetical protein PR048_032514 [Dryococelus australis]